MMQHYSVQERKAFAQEAVRTSVAAVAKIIGRKEATVRGWIGQFAPEAAAKTKTQQQATAAAFISPPPPPPPPPEIYSKADEQRASACPELDAYDMEFSSSVDHLCEATDELWDEVIADHYSSLEDVAGDWISLDLDDLSELTYEQADQIGLTALVEQMVEIMDMSEEQWPELFPPDDAIAQHVWEEQVHAKASEIWANEAVHRTWSIARGWQN